MKSNRSRRQPWSERAIADLAGLRSSDALLALVLEYESLLAEKEHGTLYQLVAIHARQIDRRVLDHLALNSLAFPLIAWNAALSLDAAEWMAVHLVAGVRPPDHPIAMKLYHGRNGALRELIRRFCLTGRTLAAHVLFNEARGKPMTTAFARNALERLLFFPELPAHWLDCLAREWHEDPPAFARLEQYRSAERRRGNRT